MNKLLFASGSPYLCYQCPEHYRSYGALLGHEFKRHKQHIAEYYYYVTPDGLKFMSSRTSLHINKARRRYLYEEERHRGATIKRD